MTDILDKLGDLVRQDCIYGNSIDVINEATVEIRRLREQKDYGYELAGKAGKDLSEALLECDKYRQQVQELKEALQAIVSEYMGSVFTKKEIARKALDKLGGEDASTDD